MLEKFKNDLLNHKPIFIKNIYQLYDYCNIINDDIGIKFNKKELILKYRELEENNVPKNHIQIRSYHIVLELTEQQQIIIRTEDLGSSLYNYPEQYISNIVDDLLQRHHIKLYEPFRLYEYQPFVFFITIKGSMMKTSLEIHQRDYIQIFNDGFIKILNDDLHIRPTAPPEIGTTYYYKRYNMQTDELEIMHKQFIDHLDMYNYKTNNCFMSEEECKRFCKLTKKELI